MTGGGVAVQNLNVFSAQKHDLALLTSLPPLVHQQVKDRYQPRGWLVARTNGEGPFYGWWRPVAPSGAQWRKSAAVGGGGVGCEYVADINKYNFIIRGVSIWIEEANTLVHN